MVNHGFPHRVTTMVENASSAPTTAPEAMIGFRWCRACAMAGRTSGRPGRETAKAKTALRNYAEAATMPSGVREGLAGRGRDLFGGGGVGIVSPAWELRCQRLPAVTFASG